MGSANIQYSLELAENCLKLDLLDAHIVDVRVDRHRNLLLMRVESDSLPEVPEGGVTPLRTATFENVKDGLTARWD